MTRYGKSDTGNQILDLGQIFPQYIIQLIERLCARRNPDGIFKSLLPGDLQCAEYMKIVGNDPDG